MMLVPSTMFTCSSASQFDAVKELLTAGKGTLGGWPPSQWGRRLDSKVSFRRTAGLFHRKAQCLSKQGPGAPVEVRGKRRDVGRPPQRRQTHLLATPQHDFNGWLYSIRAWCKPWASRFSPGLAHGRIRNRFELLSFRIVTFYRNDRCCLDCLQTQDGNANIVPQNNAPEPRE